MKKISVIIPMYNSERYIEQCLCSVTGQTYGNLEIIVVDDGSADDGTAICGRLAETDGRIRVLQQKNSGVSAARNLGLNAATGEYVFFLDSDDAVHPLLLEEMLLQAEKNHAQLAFCGYRKLDSGRLGAVLEEVSGLAGTEAAGAELPEGVLKTASGEELPENVRETAWGKELPEGVRETAWGKELPEGVRETGRGEDLPEGAREPAQGVTVEKRREASWLTADEAETEEWFHVKYTDTLSGIGGKLILREAVGRLRFDSGLTNGEDTFFLYQLVRSRVRSVYCQEEWYYYRMHGESVTSSEGTARSKRYFESALRIRDGEYGRGNADYAMRWEILTVNQIRRSYEAQKRGKQGNAETIRSTEKRESAEIIRSTEKQESAETIRSAEKQESAEAIRSAEKQESAEAIRSAEKAVGAGNVGADGKTDRAGGAERERQGLKEIAAEQMRHPLFRRICLSDRLLFASCFGCYPVYAILNRIVLGLAKRRRR